MIEKKVVKQQVDIPIKPKLPGYEISIDDLNKQIVRVHLYKGKISALDLYESGKIIMFNLKIQFTGNLSKYIPIDASAAKETIETVDIDLEFLELFFRKTETQSSIRAMFSPLVNKYHGVLIGQKVGTITLSYAKFTEFVNYIQYLSYAPFINDGKM